MTVTSRSDAGLPATGAWRRALSAVVGITVHYSTGEELGGPAARPWWRAIWRYHVERRGYDDIAYHFGIDMRTGEILQGRPLEYGGGHSSGHNTGWIGVCFLGDDDPGRDVSDAAWESYVWLVRHIEARVGRSLRVEPHRVQKERQGGGTACPGNEIVARLAAGFPEEQDMVKPDLVVYARRGVDFGTASAIANARGGAGCVVTLDAVLAQRWVDTAGVRVVALGGGSVKDLRGEVEVVGADALATMIDAAGLAG